jgi:diguanylate cyclase
MPFPGLSHDMMRKALGELDQALFHHEEWSEGLNRTLICHLSPDGRDIEDDSSRKCRFGQWLYSPGAETLAQHPAFAQIEALHERMHQCARHLLVTSGNGESIQLNDYERFINTLRQMRLEILTTKHELEDAIYNLDPLTGTASRVGMLTKLREQQALVQRKVQFCCLAMMDIDLFKLVNDKYGHAEGDRVLAALAHQLKTELRPYDVIFRYGGEEFLVCMPTMEIKTGYAAIDRLRQSVSDMGFKSERGEPFRVTVSFGLTLLDADVSVETSIERADKALYAAKAGGRNRVVVWEASMI